MFNSCMSCGTCTQAVDIFCSSLDDASLIEGLSDVIVIKQKSGEFRSTKFYVCMGPYSSTSRVKVFVNSKLINEAKFTVNKYGYLTPNTLSSK